ncbi:MAG: hypothetical protein JXR58_03635 [Bacteroidales bacterium]|nr:hypothetical protein [Bacteroidales bacterium]
MRKIAVIFFLIISLSSFACHRAYQYRLFPIAISDSSLLFLQIEMIRDATNKNSWSGTANILSFENNSLSVFYSLDSIMLNSDNYSNELEKIFFKAKEKIDGNIYEYLDISKIKLCRHQPQCAGLLLHRISKDSIFIKNEQKSVLIDLPKNSLAERELVAAGGMGEPFNLNSVREFYFKGKKILLVNVGTGEKESSDYKHLIKDQMQYENNPFFPELTLYHGFCFDMILFEN